MSTSLACPEVACVDGEKCEEAPDCSSEEVHQCVSIDCNADSDCADDMVCETVTTGKCLIGLICGSMSRLNANRHR